MILDELLVQQTANLLQFQHDSIHSLQFFTDGVRVVCDGMEEEEEKAGEEGEAEEEDEGDL